MFTVNEQWKDSDFMSKSQKENEWPLKVCHEVGTSCKQMMKAGRENTWQGGVVCEPWQGTTIKYICFT